MTTREKLTKEILRIKPEITSQDKKEAVKKLKLKLKLCNSTLSVYLNNPSEVKNLDKLYDLIVFFNEKIKARHEKIDTLTNKN